MRAALGGCSYAWPSKGSKDRSSADGMFPMEFRASHGAKRLPGGAGPYQCEGRGDRGPTVTSSAAPMDVGSLGIVLSMLASCSLATRFDDRPFLDARGGEGEGRQTSKGGEEGQTCAKEGRQESEADGQEAGEESREGKDRQAREESRTRQEVADRITKTVAVWSFNHIATVLSLPSEGSTWTRNVAAWRTRHSRY